MVALIPEKQKQLKEINTKYGAKSLGEVTVSQVRASVSPRMPAWMARASRKSHTTPRANPLTLYPPHPLSPSTPTHCVPPRCAGGRRRA